MFTPSQRPLRRVPALLLCAFAGILAAQVAWRAAQPPPLARAVDLPQPPAAGVMRAGTLGDPVLVAKLLVLWLQAYDNQPGVSIPFRDLDYARVTAWLKLILTLDPRAQYPLLAASRLYGEVPDPLRSRRMLDFVYAEFARDPARRWPWLAHAVYLAKHRLHDQELALRYARALAAQPDTQQIPAWARQLEVFVLADMGEIEAAKVLLGGLLASGRITDPHERWLLSQRLEALQQAH